MILEPKGFLYGKKRWKKTKFSYFFRVRFRTLFYCNFIGFYCHCITFVRTHSRTKTGRPNAKTNKLTKCETAQLRFSHFFQIKIPCTYVSQSTYLMGSTISQGMKAATSAGIWRCLLSFRYSITSSILQSLQRSAQSRVEMKWPSIFMGFLTLLAVSCTAEARLWLQPQVIGQGQVGIYTWWIKGWNRTLPLEQVLVLL